VGFCAVLEALLRTGSQGGLTGKDVVEIFVDAARPIEGEPKLRSRVPGELYEGPLWRFVEQRVLTALREGKPTSEALGAWYSGAYLLETMPTVLYLVARLLDEPQECLLRAVNDTYDNDTIAALCGAALGARHGFDAFPRPWREGLLGRTGPEDDGHVFTVVDRLKRLGGHLGVPQEAFRKPR
jgi:hypothetical protein